MLSSSVTPVSGETPSPGPSTNGAVNAVIEDLNRPPRLPRWTRQEILVLIQGKKVVESRVRRVGRAAHASSAGSVEPKWASVASYCRKHGVNRGPVQCRKRWSNLAVDFRKIKEWESKIVDDSDSFWIMRSDVRRERKLPGFFDREVYDILDGGETEKKAEIEEDEAGFDEDRGRAEDGMVLEFERAEREEAVDEGLDEGGIAAPAVNSEKQNEPDQAFSEPGTTNEKQPDTNPEGEHPSQEGQKQKQASPERREAASLQERLIDVLDQNGRMLMAQLEAQNMNCQLDRDQRKDHVESLVGVLSKVADALGRIADKL